MKIFKHKFIQSLGVYTFSNVLNSAIPFILLPILTVYLSPSDYGVLTNFNSLLAFLVPFVGLNLSTSLQVIYVKQESEFPAYVSTGLGITLFLTLVFSSICIVFSQQIYALTGIPNEFIWFVGLYACFQNTIEVLLSFWRMEDKAIHYGVFRVIRTLIELGLACLFIIYFKHSFSGSIDALAISYGIGTIFTLFYLLKRKILVLKFEKKHAQHLLRYGVPLIPHVMGSVFIMYTDKLVLTQFHGLASNGIYSVGFMVGQVIGLFQNSFNQAWIPWVYKRLGKNDDVIHLRIVKWTYLYFAGILVVSILFYLCSPIIFYFLGKSYASGMDLVLWISLGFAFNGMYKMVGVYFFYLEKTTSLALISLFTAGINIGFAFLLIPDYGYFGAAIGTMSSFLLQFILTWWWGNRIYPMPWFGIKKTNDEKHSK